MSTSIYFAIGGLIFAFISKLVIDFIFARLERKDRDEAVDRLNEAMKYSERRMEERMREVRKRIK